MFEIAAFLKSKEKRERRLLICPTLTGPVSFAVYAISTIGFIPLLVAFPIDHHPQTAWPYVWYVTGFTTIVNATAYASCHIMRRFYRSIEVMQRQLLSLQIDQLKCSCCSTGKCARAQFCDRRVISECIGIWFGSSNSFAEYIRTTVVDAVTAQLEHDAFSFAWSVAIICPAMWGIFDFMQHALRPPHPDGLLISVCFYLMTTVFLICPVCVSWMKFLAYHLRHESRSRCGEVLTNSIMIFRMMPVLVFSMGAYMAGNVFLARYNETVFVIAIVAFLVPGWALMWFLYRRANSGYLSHFIWQQRLVQEGVAQGRTRHSL